MNFDIDGLDAFAKALEDAANGELKREYILWLEGIGMEFLDVIQDEIKRTKTVDTARLLNSFGKGNKENFWYLSEGKLAIEVGTNLNYARYVSDGHFLNPKGVDTRWVPGRWRGTRFEYDPNAKTGMLLKQKWIEGTGYWDNALAIFEKMFQNSLDRRLQEWLDKYF